MEDGINKIGEVDGVIIYYDKYHPAKQVTVKLNDAQTEIEYIISSYEDIKMFENLKKVLPDEE